MEDDTITSLNDEVITKVRVMLHPRSIGMCVSVCVREGGRERERERERKEGEREKWYCIPSNRHWEIKKMAVTTQVMRNKDQT